jgi:cytochrome b6-f complex iron-sulfur subunit
MTSSAIIAIAIIVVVLLGAVLLVGNVRRRDTRKAEGVLSRETRAADRGAVTPTEPLTGRSYEQAALAKVEPSTELVPVAAAAPPAPYVPPDPEQVGVTRRQFLNRSSVTLMGIGLAGFGGAVLAFLWPKLSGGFGSKITVGKVDEVQSLISQNDGFFYLAEGRAWLTSYPAESLPKAERVYQPAVVTGLRDAGVMALYQKCPHLGCRVPECKSSQWFECPCHGSQYNRAGEKKAGPAPRGMDRFGVAVAGGNVVVDTGTVLPGPPIGTNTTGQEAEGPHCITGGEGGHSG